MQKTDGTARVVDISETQKYFSPKGKTHTRFVCACSLVGVQVESKKATISSLESTLIMQMARSEPDPGLVVSIA